MQKQVLLTPAGHQQITEELEELRTVRRQEVAEKIKQARGFGDLSENSEYDEAKNEQAQVESRITELENMLKVAVVMTKDHIEKDVVSIGTTVTLVISEDGADEEAVFRLVGSNEANPMEGRISDESPVGAALIGHKKGETVEVHTPFGVTAYKIVDVEESN